jgi:hypothetical protein
VTRRTRGNHHSRRAISLLAFVVSLIVLALSSSCTADAARIAQAYSRGVTAAALGGDLVVPTVANAPAGPDAPPDIPATGNSSRPVVRIGALLFALGSIATYVASGTRRNAVREVDPDGNDL